MYTSIYIHRVPEDRVGEIVEILGEAARVYGELGVLDCQVFEASDLSARYGCSSFPDSMEVGEGETVLVELNIFRDRQHHDSAMEEIDRDARIDELYHRFSRVLDVGRVVRGEFSRVL